MRQALRTLRLRTLAVSAVAPVALCMVVGLLTYTAGLSAGEDKGEVVGRTMIQATMNAGPDAALDWALLMANNNPGPELALCRKNIASMNTAAAPAPCRSGWIRLHRTAAIATALARFWDQSAISKIGDENATQIYKKQ